MGVIVLTRPSRRTESPARRPGGMRTAASSEAAPIPPPIHESRTQSNAPVLEENAIPTAARAAAPASVPTEEGCGTAPPSQIPTVKAMAGKNGGRADTSLHFNRPARATQPPTYRNCSTFLAGGKAQRELND